MAVSFLLLLLAASAPAREFRFHCASWLPYACPEWGGSGVVAGGHAENLCAKLGIEPGHSRSASVEVNPYARVFRPGTLLCARAASVRYGVSGQPAEGVSIRCPPGQRPSDGGAGYWDSGGNLTQWSGGFGYNKDGYWHYRWINWSASPVVTVQLWAVCHRPFAIGADVR